jgi:hypothetical protein
MTRSIPRDLSIELDATDAAPLGAPVLITIRVKNLGKIPLELYLRGREIAYDIAIMGSGGETVWRRLEGAIVPAILRLEILEPGGVIELRDSWNQRDRAGELVPPGVYTILARVLSERDDLEPSPAKIRLGV